MRLYEARMSAHLLNVLTYSLLPVATAVIGGILATVRPPGSRVRSYIQHFAAGVVFSVVAVELLPDVMRQHQPFPAIIGFTLGTAAMLLIRWLARGSETMGEQGASVFPTALLAGVGVDILIDGLLLGIGFAAGRKEGTLLAFALATELLSLGLATAAALGSAGQPRRRVIGIISGLSLLIVAGAAGGATVLTLVSHSAMEAVLSFGLAALLFLVTEELLVEAHEEPETPLATATFFLGFLLFLILGMVG